MNQTLSVYTCGACNETRLFYQGIAEAPICMHPYHMVNINLGKLPPLVPQRMEFVGHVVIE